MLKRAAQGDRDDQLNAYPLENGKVLRVVDVSPVHEKTILSFMQAKQLERLNVDAFLETEYRKIRTLSPTLFKTESGDWKPLTQAKELMIRELFKDLFTAIQNDEGVKGKLPLEFYWTHRLSYPMKEALASLKTDASSDFGLWTVEQSERTSEEFMKEPFILQTGDWSPVFVPPSGEITFYFVKERSVKPSSVLHQIELGHEVLAADTKRLLAEQLLEVMQKKQAIHLPIRGEE